MDEIGTDSWDCSPSLPIPLDILFDVVQHLPLQSILALRQVCAPVLFHGIFKSDFLSSRPVKVFMLSRGCAVSGLSFCGLSSRSKISLYPASTANPLTACQPQSSSGLHAMHLFFATTGLTLIRMRRGKLIFTSPPNQIRALFLCSFSLVEETVG
jgi:hypothetical protein